MGEAGAMLEVLLNWRGAGDDCTLASTFLATGAHVTVGEAEGCDAFVPASEGGSGQRIVVRCARGRVEILLGDFIIRTRLVPGCAKEWRTLRPRLDFAMLRPLSSSVLAHAIALAVLAFRGAASVGADGDNDALAVRSRLLAAIEARPAPVEAGPALDVDRHAPPARTFHEPPVRAPDSIDPEPEPLQPPRVGGRGFVLPGDPVAPGWGPIGFDAPNLLEMIQRQVASWDPKAVTGKYFISHGAAGASSGPSQYPWDRVPQSVIASVVGANMGRFHVCHSVGLPSSVDVGGEVRVSFVITPEGTVSEAHDLGGTFPDDAVRQCVVRTFLNLSFTAPPRGSPQIATYSVALAEGDVLVRPADRPIR
jgi:hypothetical protein